MGYRRGALLKRKPAFTAPETTLAPPPVLKAPAPQANVAASAQSQTEQAVPEQDIQPIGHDFSQITIYGDQQSTAPATPTPPAGPSAPSGDGGAGVDAGASAAPSHQIGLPASGMLAQAALRVNAPGDPFEQEADLLADRVMQMPTVFPPGQAAPEPATPGMQVQRSSDASGGEAPPAVEAGVARLQGGGAPLPASERAFFEPRMGVDLGQVRIQDSSEAAAMSQALNARAFTVGNTIAFDLGEYRPGTETGRHLLAHELAHTVQQTGGVAAKRAGLSIQRTTWERDDPTIWSPDFGRQYEEKYGANIAGNYPTIDHFDRGSGLAVSLKTMNLIDNYQLDGGAAQVQATILNYINALKGFIPSTYGGVTIRPEEVKKLRLQIAVPPKEDCPKPDLFDKAMEWDGKSIDSGISLVQREGRLRSLRSHKKQRIDDKQLTEDSQATSSSDAMQIDSDETASSSAAAASADTSAPEILLEIRIEARDDLDWGPGPGALYEQALDANIGGTFPTIDDFRDGTATSLKTVNIVENYGSVQALTVRIEQYIAEMDKFDGRMWPQGNNHGKTDPSLVKMWGGKPHIHITKDAIKERVLQIGIPPVSTLLADSDRLYTGKTRENAASNDDKTFLQQKYAYIMGLNGKQQGRVTIKVEERD